jgi:MFS family permease
MRVQMSGSSPTRLISKKDFLVIFILLFNTLTWYYGISTALDEAIRNLDSIVRTLIWVIYISAIIGFGIFSSILLDKLQTTHFLYSWMLLGAVSSLLLILLDNPTLLNASITSFSLGATFGLGMPSCLSYYADHSNIENRGIIAGILLLGANIGTPLFGFLVRISDLLTTSICLAFWRLLGLILTSLLEMQEITEGRKRTSFLSVLQNRVFILFLTPWLMFCLIDSFETIVLQRVLDADFYSFMLAIEAIIGGIFTLLGGWLCDLLGRKRVVIYGFVALGLAYAIISIFPSTISWYIYFILDGFSVGMLWVAFILILWADLSQQSGREKYYAIGGIPFFIAPLIRLLLAPFVHIPAYAAFSLASFFLFLAVIPLMYAPETLPEKKLEARKLKQYIEEAKKLKERHVKRNKQ